MTDRRDMLNMLLAMAAGAAAKPAQGAEGPSVREIFRQPLPADYGGREAVFVEVTWAPGASSNAHRHPDLVLGYVLEGRFRFSINGETARVLEAGEAFYEPPDALHGVSANAGSDGPARVLAIQFLRPGDPLVLPAEG